MSLNRSLSAIFKFIVKYDIRTYQTDGCHANVILVLLLINQEWMTNAYQFSRCIAYFTLAATHCQQCIHRTTKAKQQLFYLRQLMCCLAVSEKRSTQNDRWSNSSPTYFFIYIQKYLVINRNGWTKQLAVKIKSHMLELQCTNCTILAII